MDRFYLYHGSFALIGVGLTIDTVLSVTTSGLGVFDILQLLGGGGMVLVSTYAVLTTDLADVTIGRYQTRTVVFGAQLALLGSHSNYCR